MKFTIKELNVLVRGTRLAMEETREHHEKCNTDTTRWWYEEAKRLHERIEDKLWREVRKEEDAFWAKAWGDSYGPAEPGAYGMYMDASSFESPAQTVEKLRKAGFDLPE